MVYEHDKSMFFSSFPCLLYLFSDMDIIFSPALFYMTLFVVFM